MLQSFYFPHDRVILDCGDELITKQSAAAECDINNIISQFSRTGIISHINSSSSSFTDLPDFIDFQASISIVSDATAAFASLPSKVRDRYSNDPGVFLSALSSPDERAFLTEVGVFRAPPPSAPTVPPVGGASPGAPASGD